MRMFICIFSQNCINLFLNVLKHLRSLCNFELIKRSQQWNFISKHFFVYKLHFFFWFEVNFLVAQLFLQLFNLDISFLNFNSLSFLLLVIWFLPKINDFFKFLLRNSVLHLFNDFFLTLSNHVHHVWIYFGQDLAICQQLLSLVQSLLKCHCLGSPSHSFMRIVIQFLYLRLILCLRRPLCRFFLLFDQILQSHSF